MNKDNIQATGYEATEAELVNKVNDQQRYFGAGVRRVMRLFALVRNDQRTADAMSRAYIHWADAGVRSDAQLVDAMLKRRDVGYPFEYLLEMDGHSPQEIERIMKMRRAEQSDPALAELADLYRNS